MSMKINVVSSSAGATVLLGDASIGCLYSLSGNSDVLIVPLVEPSKCAGSLIPVLRCSRDGGSWDCVELSVGNRLVNVTDRLDISISGNDSFVGFDASKVFVKQAFISSCEIEKLREENKKLKGAIANIYRNCEECEFNGSSTYYAVEQDYVNEAYELVNPKN